MESLKMSGMSKNGLRGNSKADPLPWWILMSKVVEGHSIK
jgi:hypothetical protein